MRFKIFYNETAKALDINCISNKSSEIVIPEDLNQHVYYPLPADVEKHAKKHLMDLLTVEETEVFQKLLEDISELQRLRKEKLNEIRERLNPEIIRRCEDLRLLYPEFYI